jgi:membrane associated rhomboid family serine protease
MRSIIEDVKREFETGNNITRLILINVIVFVVISLLKVFANFPGSSGGSTWYDFIWRNLTLSSDWVFNLTHPWVFITHMFLHVGLWHIIWNMLFLYWFGRRVGDLISDKHIYPIYFYGGIAGAIALLLSASAFGYLSASAEVFAHGASAAVMAFVVAAAVLNPESYMHLILIGPVKIKYVAFAIVFLDIIALGSNVNTGGHFGHLGGAAMGWFYIYALRNGWNLAPDFNSSQETSGQATIRMLSDHPSSASTKKRHSPSKSFKNYFTGKEDSSDAVIRNIDDEVDRILDKIRSQGIDSLTENEKATLKHASKDS